jgi:hypothetical protein
MYCLEVPKTSCVTSRKLHTKIWLENMKERDHSEDLGIDGKIILEWIIGR